MIKGFAGRYADRVKKLHVKIWFPWVSRSDTRAELVLLGVGLMFTCGALNGLQGWLWRACSLVGLFSGSWVVSSSMSKAFATFRRLRGRNILESMRTHQTLDELIEQHVWLN